MNSIHLLLADDDQDDCSLFQEALQELALSVDLTTVNDGEQLMNQLSEKEKVPNLLFLDLNMPRKNGFECLSEIKRSEKLKDIPVIVYSTSFQPDIVNLLYSKGARHYVNKPAEFSKLKQLIQIAITVTEENPSSQPDKATFVITI